MLVQPYLFFNGRAEEAAAFYQRVLGAKVDMMMRYSDSPEPAPPGMLPPGSGNKVMHMALTIGDTQVMGSDGECGGKTDFQGFSLSLTAKSEAEADRVFAALAEGGQVRMPLAKTFFSPKFGMLADKFGLGWMVLVAE
jgi:PhnB protein